MQMIQNTEEKVLRGENNVNIPGKRRHLLNET